MPLLKVDLQEGFSGDALVLRINDKEVYRGTPRTRMQIGLADSKTFELPPQKLTLEAEMPAKGASQSIVLDLTQDLNVGVTLGEGGVISLRSSLEPYGYV